MHTAEIYTELLDWVCHKILYAGRHNDIKRCPLWRGYLTYSFPLRARQATVYIFSAGLPNSYLRDKSQHGVEDKPTFLILIKSTFRNQNLGWGALNSRPIFRLLSTVFYYTVSGNSIVDIYPKMNGIHLKRRNLTFGYIILTFRNDRCMVFNC